MIESSLLAHPTRRSCADFGEHFELVTIKDNIINELLHIQEFLAPYCCYGVSSYLLNQKKQDTKYFCQYSFEVPNNVLPEYHTKCQFDTPKPGKQPRITCRVLQ